jgi:hypothetical protein
VVPVAWRFRSSSNEHLLGATGFELPADSAGNTPIGQDSGAKSGAVCSNFASAGTLETLAADLARLSSADRERLAAMLLSGQGEEKAGWPVADAPDAG